MDVIERLPDCDGQAADAVVSIHSDDGGRARIAQNSKVSINVDTSSTTSGPNLGETFEDPVVLLERNLYGHLTRWSLVGKTVRGSSAGTGMGKGSELSMSLFVENKDHSCHYTWMIRKSGKKQNMAPMWKKSMKYVDLDGLTSFLDQKNWGRTQRECKPNEIIVQEDREMFGSRISAGATEKLSGWEGSHAKTVAWSYDMEEHAQKSVERWRIGEQKDSSFSKSQVLAWVTIISRNRNVNHLEICQKVLSQSVLKCSYLAGIGRPDLVSKQACSISHQLDRSL